MDDPQKTEIGVSTLRYNEDGKPPVIATFVPATYQVDVSKIVRDLSAFDADTVPEAQQHAQSVLASWFSSMDLIELTDRETGKIESEIVTCEKWPNGRPKTCVIRFYFVRFQGS